MGSLCCVRIGTTCSAKVFDCKETARTGSELLQQVKKTFKLANVFNAFY